MGDQTFAVCDYWRTHDPSTDALIAALTDGMTRIDDVERAHLVIHSVYGQEHRRARGALARFDAEPSEPNARRATWRIDWRHDTSPDHLRLPLWAYGLSSAISDLSSVENAGDPSTRRFCNFISSNHASPTRNAFFEMLHRRKPVDALGAAHRNRSHPLLAPRTTIGGMSSKLAVQREYRLTLAFENSEHVGYTTEKLLDAFRADTVPIYWGNPAVEVDFAPNSYVSYYQHGSLSRLADAVLEIENDPARYETYRQANPLRTGVHGHVKVLAGGQEKSSRW